MQSVRLNRKGEQIPSLKDAWDLYRVQQHQSRDHTRISHPYANCDEGGMTDEDWSEYNRQRAQRGQTTLAANTSLGTSAAILRQVPRTQDDLNLFLTQHNRWAVGDFLTFSNYLPDNAMVTMHTVTFLLATERDIAHVHWKPYEDVPKPFLLLSLSPCSPMGLVAANKQSPWPVNARYDHCLYKRHLSQNEYNGIIKTNVQLQDYIEQAKAALKAGKLKIEG